MYIKRYSNGTERDYTHVKSLSFSQEADLTLATIPINEFTAEIITDDDIAVGDAVDLLDDMDNLWARFYVMKSERVRHDIVRVLAQSPLALMDKWTLAAEAFGPVGFQAFLGRIFSDTPVSGVKHVIPWELDAFYTFKDYPVCAFCPEQTARERLQWLCLYIGATVRQGYSGVLRIEPSPYVDPEERAAKGTLIPISDTYWQPTVETRDPVGSVSITLYTSPSQTQDPQDDMRSEDADGVTWYYASRQAVWDNASEEGERVGIDGVTLLNVMQYSNHPEVFSGLVQAYYSRREIRLDVVNNFRYRPGQKVRVYSDPETIYEGIIRSCNFTFGSQAKSRLVVCTGLEPIPTSRLVIIHRYGDDEIGRQEYVLPDGDDYDYANPDITWYTPNGDSITYKPSTPRTQGTLSGDSEVTADYGLDQPARIEVVTPPNITVYTDGDLINYTGLRVIVYDGHGRPWTNDGRYPGGIIPQGDLILNTIRASIPSSDAVSREAYGEDGAVYHGQSGTEVYVWPKRGNPAYDAPEQEGDAAQEGQAQEGEAGEEPVDPKAFGEHYWVDLEYKDPEGPFYTFGHIWDEKNGGLGRGAFICSPSIFWSRSNKSSTRLVPHSYKKYGTSQTVYYNGRDAYQSYYLPETDQPLNEGDVGVIAWTLCFGEHSDLGTKNVEVFWIRPSDGSFLGASFPIVIRGRMEENAEQEG